MSKHEGPFMQTLNAGCSFVVLLLLVLAVMAYCRGSG